MKESAAVGEGLLAFYAAFSSGDPEQFGNALAEGPGVSVIGSAPDEGHDARESWLGAYADGIAESGLSLRGDGPRGWEEGTMGFAIDRPSFVLPDGSALPTRLTAVLRRDDGAWKVVHLHFSVGVPDEDAIQAS